MVSNSIATSHAKIQLFETVKTELNYTGRGPISGHGHRWGIVLDSQTRSCEAKKVSFLSAFTLSSIETDSSLCIVSCDIYQVINQILHDDEEGYFNGVSISRDEWKAVEALNKLLEVSSIITFIKYISVINQSRRQKNTDIYTFN